MGNTAGIDEDMIDAGGWENVPMDFGETAQEGQVDPSHEGGRYFNFIDIAQESFSWYTFHKIGYKKFTPTGSNHNTTLSAGI